MIREEVSQATLTLPRLNNRDHSADEAIRSYPAKIVDRVRKRQELKRRAEEDQKRDDDFNYRDDQFD